jgi:hypothetical protein
MYDRPLAAHGLTWAELTAWWADREGMTGTPAREVSSSLYRRLDRSLGDNDAEQRILRTYADRYRNGARRPAARRRAVPAVDAAQGRPAAMEPADRRRDDHGDTDQQTQTGCCPS